MKMNMIHEEFGKITMSRRDINKKPQGFICFAPEGVPLDALDLVDDIDPETQEVRGKKAVVNQAKVDALDSAKSAEQVAFEARRQAREAALTRLKQSKNQEMLDLLMVLGY